MAHLEVEPKPSRNWIWILIAILIIGLITYAVMKGQFTENTDHNNAKLRAELKQSI